MPSYTTPTLAIEAFITRCSDALGYPIPPPKDIFSFGGNKPQSTDRLLSYAIAGTKTATTSWPIPSPLYWGPGDYSVILNSAGEPAALMRTLSFRECEFKDVEVEFGEAEGEGSYEEYRQGHFTFYRSESYMESVKGELREGDMVFGEESMVLYQQILYADKDLISDYTLQEYSARLSKIPGSERTNNSRRKWVSTKFPSKLRGWVNEKEEVEIEPVEFADLIERLVSSVGEMTFYLDEEMEQPKDTQVSLKDFWRMTEVPAGTT